MAKKGKIDKFATEEEERPIRIKKYKYLFLIVCEDEKTEPNYFEKFKSKIPEETLFLKTVGTGRDPKGVVECAIMERDSLQALAKKEVDEVWVVFDKDDADKNATTIKNFNTAFSIAEEQNFNLAYSNEAFELWLLLHFTKVDHKTLLSRNRIYELLQEKIRLVKKYNSYVYNHEKPNHKTIEIIFEIGDYNLAISRSKELFEKQKHKKPIDANPSTKVHCLVEALLNWISYFED